MSLTSNADRIRPLESSHFWFVGRDRLLSDLMSRHTDVTPASIIADIGCGTGTFAGSLAKAGHPVVAVDIDLPEIVPDGPLFARCDMAHLPFSSSSVDVLFVRDVLEHVDDDAAALTECRRVLSDVGVLIATVPAWPVLWSHRDIVAGHKRRYTRRRLLSLCESSGFAVREVRGYQMLALPIVALSRLMARRNDSQLRREESLGVSNTILGALTRAELALGKVGILRPRTGSTLALVAIPSA